MKILILPKNVKSVVFLHHIKATIYCICCIFSNIKNIGYKFAN